MRVRCEQPRPRWGTPCHGRCSASARAKRLAASRSAAASPTHSSPRGTGSSLHCRPPAPARTLHWRRVFNALPSRRATRGHAAARGGARRWSGAAAVVVAWRGQCVRRTLSPSVLPNDLLMRSTKRTLEGRGRRRPEAGRDGGGAVGGLWVNDHAPTRAHAPSHCSQRPVRERKPETRTLSSRLQKIGCFRMSAALGRFFATGASIALMRSAA